MGRMCRVCFCPTPRTGPCSKHLVGEVRGTELQSFSDTQGSSDSAPGIPKDLSFPQWTVKAELLPPCLWPCVQDPQHRACAPVPPLADLPQGGRPEHGHIPEPVSRDLLLQWEHYLLEHPHVQAHLRFLCLCERLAPVTQGGLVSRDTLSFRLSQLWVNLVGPKQ